MRRLLFIVALMMPWLCAMASTNYEPHGFVNDFANIIPDDREAVLEQQLRAYEKETSVELAVVTTPSLDGEPIETWSVALATRWGVGKKDADNGLLLVVAPNEREYRVEVGYGLEGVIPDATASRLSRTILPDAFRNNEYAGGIERLMSAFMNTIGHTSAEDRARIQAEQARIQALQAERQKQQAVQFMYAVVVVLAIAVALVCAYLLIRRIIVSVKKRRALIALRKEVVANLATHDAELLRIRDVEAHVPITRLPAWIQENVRQHRESITQGLLSLANLKEEIHALAHFDPEKAQRVFADYTNDVERVQRHASTLERIDMEVERFRMRVAKVVHETTRDVESLTTTIHELTTAGYRLDAYITPTDLEEITRTCDSVVKDLVARGRGVADTSDTVLARSRELHSRVRELQSSLDATRDLKQHVDDVIPGLEASIEEVTKMYAMAGHLLTEIRSSAPERVWKDVALEFGNVPELLASVSLFLASAKESGSMNVQNFADARESIAKAETLLGRVRAAFTSVEELHAQLRSAQEDTPEATKKTEHAINDAQSVIAHQAVGSDAHDKLTQAKKKLEEARSLLASSPIDWLLVLTGVLAAFRLAQTAQRLAEEDISQARRNEEKRKLHKAREEESRRRSYVSSSSSSSRSSGSGGFGGFGGGGFGGGGASGRW